MLRRDVIKLGILSALNLATGQHDHPKVKFRHKRHGPMHGLHHPPPGMLDGKDVPKYRQPLMIPDAMPRTSTVPFLGRNADYYEIAVRQIKQRVLPPPFQETDVWGFGSPHDPKSFSYPSFTIEARVDKPTIVRWANELVDARGNFLPHLLPVDPTLHWANPPGGDAGRDGRPTFASTPGTYKGPVPIVVHLHGAHTPPENDGYPQAWFLPAAHNIPSGYAKKGSFYDMFRNASPLGSQWTPDSSVYFYPNDQRATALWFHDHSLGLTRVNNYAGALGFYLLRGGSDDVVPGELPGPAPRRGDRPNQDYFEIPLVLHDRLFNTDGSLFFPDSRTFFDGFAGPYIPTSDIAPIFNPEVFGNTIVVNGQTWPYLRVEQRRYRFRILNASNARFFILRLSNAQPFFQIGSDGGFLPAPVQQSELLIAPAERRDVIVDFTDIPVGTEVLLLNFAPDEPFGGGAPGVDFDAADPDTTGQVMQFRVTRSRSVDRSTPPMSLTLPAITSFGPESNLRQLSLSEADSDVLADVGPRAAFLGTLEATGEPNPLMWEDPITENPALGATEVWEVHNTTEDAHAIHIHQVQFQIVDREDPAGRQRGPEPSETGFKDTVIAYPGEITRVRAKFDIPGTFVWHCHMLDHEDNEMMRPYKVG